MSRGTQIGISGVRYMPDAHIEREANHVLDAWAAGGNPRCLPVPIDEIIELHLGLTLEFVDLCSQLGIDDVLGAIFPDRKLIKIDSSLEAPAMRGRCAFTMAHEVGHWVLHRDLITIDAQQSKLFGLEPGPVHVCRSNSKPREEVQADMFAGYLLMPRAEMLSAWSEWRGTDAQVSFAEVKERMGVDDEERAVQLFVRPLADTVGVSAQALGIRLRALKLIVGQVQPSLFG